MPQIMVPGGAEKGPSSSSEEKSGCDLGKRWLVAELVFAILPFVFILAWCFKFQNHDQDLEKKLLLGYI